MRIIVHIGLAHAGAGRVHRVAAEKRAQLASKGILLPKVLGQTNHSRLYMAVTDPDHVDPLRRARGLAAPQAQAEHRQTISEELKREVERADPDILLLSAHQLATSLHRRSELERLKELLTPFSNRIEVVAHVDAPARLLAKAYATQVLSGRAAPLDRDIQLANAASWWDAALATGASLDVKAGQFLETDAAPFWIDLPRLAAFWGDVFEQVTFRPYDSVHFAGANATEELRAAFDIDPSIGKAAPEDLPMEPSAAWLARARQFNALVQQLHASGKKRVEPVLWNTLLREIAIDGPALDPGALFPVSDHFSAHLPALLPNQPALSSADLQAPAPRPAWREADPGRGFRASQYLLAFMFRIDKAAREAKRAARVAKDAKDLPEPSDAAKTVMPPLALRNYRKLRRSPFAPHNRMGAVNEEALAAAYTARAARGLPDGSSGTVIVGCMKDEAPYILEWIAYHRAIGVDHFLIYTNDCSDGTDRILNRLSDMGIVTHRDNSGWKGKSPQQHALNNALKQPVIRKADWVIHIDVDEFINVRCGNGTLDDFRARVPEATNVAMTWRLFGHNGVTRLDDRFVIDQFDTCAPKFCPKPHTVWGFKTMSRNIGAYRKLSCHRPNQLIDDQADKVRWVNGSGRDITEEMAKKGWRSSMRSIGYDLIQLNHYALRSAESFLIKRQRGRALHVDRSIGLNYWIRMDWSDVRDITIKRNIPRLQIEYDKLMQDEALQQLHAAGLDWHRAKAAELHGRPEFEDLYQQALKIKLTEAERVAYALALDMES
ncbi:glycosyltransferase family 2 protein [Thalassococcus sp. S3]|uniref:glycosyltransferase family 2 protein n=1 Tax=Thalassococcus sp. S3 TaxID=2017482 RepID=UPI0010249174|nr:glycosyltransferase family 2 protein [Thalassococcus sp. S3]QBF31402.1 glycosyl transferase family 2 [Thalassococcus sp. S3]